MELCNKVAAVLCKIPSCMKIPNTFIRLLHLFVAPGPNVYSGMLEIKQNQLISPFTIHNALNPDKFIISLIHTLFAVGGVKTQGRSFRYVSWR